MTFPPKNIPMRYGQTTNTNRYRRLRQVHFPRTVDVTRPHIVLNSEDLQNIDPDVTLQERLEQFAPTAAAKRGMVRAQHQHAQLEQVRKAGHVEKHEEDKDKEMSFPIYAYPPGSFQAAI